MQSEISEFKTSSLMKSSEGHLLHFLRQCLSSKTFSKARFVIINNIMLTTVVKKVSYCSLTTVEISLIGTDTSGTSFVDSLTGIGFSLTDSESLREFCIYNHIS
jgi:hypothetical protein